MVVLLMMMHSWFMRVSFFSLRHMSLALLCCLPVLAACGREAVLPQPEPQPYRQSTVRDLEDFPQDLRVYARRAGDAPLLTPEQSERQTERFRKLFFAAWGVKNTTKDNLAFFKAELKRQGSKRGYAENLQPWDKERWQDLEDNADWGTFPSLRQAAITVRATNLRVVPTDRPRFSAPEEAGQGFPFDEFQQTALPVGFPLMVLHQSKDGAWLYVENAFAPGWIPAQDVAFVEEAFRRRWEAAPLIAFTEDNVPLILPSGQALAQAHIGTVLPAASSSSDMTGGVLHVLVPVRSGQGNAEIAQVQVRAGTAETMPVPLTPARIADVGNRLLGQPYGWGGLFTDRDCSAMLRDLFTPFGVWLPRNSASQAKAGTFLDFASQPLAAKEAAILRDGVPFLTVLWLRGHIGLYVGEYEGRAVMFHNIWGIRTRGERGEAGRHILGRAVITSLSPGAELPNVSEDGLLLERMLGMGILGR